MTPATQITLLLNKEVTTVSVPPGLVALDFLRKRCGLTGSKEGCKEGDCGACSVIVGELQGDKVNYRPMTSCLLPMGELHGKHLVSIEGLNMDSLSTVQQAMVDCAGTQCGYCTPGFVVAMTAGLIDESLPLEESSCSYAISGNLCRCTGYRSIKEAGSKALQSLSPKLQGKARVQGLCEAGELPAYFLDASAKLKEIAKMGKPVGKPESGYTGPIVGGGTDLFVQKGETLPETHPRLVNTSPIHPPQLRDGMIRLDARLTFEAFARSPIIQKAIPQIRDYNELVASWPIRMRATLAGNICNASPIADMTCLLMALESELVIQGDSGARTVALKNFYLGYKQLAKKPEELITEIRFPQPKENEFISWEKVSKRKILDIATVNSAAKIEVENGVIRKATLALGGVAATPLFLKETSAQLQGATLNNTSVMEAIEFAQSEFAPISDVRGSAAYKRLLARQLLLSHFTTLFPETIKEDDLYASLR